MFAQLSYSQSITDSPVTLPSQRDFLLGRPVDESSPGLMFVASVSGATGGTLGLQAIGSTDGDTYFSLGSTMAVAVGGTPDGLFYVPLLGTVPPFLGLRATPGGGFDGVISVRARSGGRIGVSLPGQP